MYANRIARPALRPVRTFGGLDADRAVPAPRQRSTDVDGAMRQAEFYAAVSLTMAVLTVASVLIALFLPVM